MVEISREPFGTVDGQPVANYHLTNGNGLQAEILTYGGIIRAIHAPGRDGALANVTLGFADLAGYLTHPDPFFGCITGRFANRLAGGQFTLDGETWQIAQNVGAHHLHGGMKGFDKFVWQAEEVQDGVNLSRTSPDGEEGYPGALETAVTYRLDETNRLWITYRAETDRSTILNLTNHTYWNLAGEGSGSIEDHLLWLAASRYTVVDADQLPTGELAPVAGTPFDFTAPTAIGARLRDNDHQLLMSQGYDHNFVFDRNPGGATLIEGVRLHHAGSGRTLSVWTTEPGVQVYTGNYLDGSFAGASGRAYRQGDGIALETQHFPDSPNHPSFPSTVLRPGEVFESTTVFALSS